MRTVTVQIQKRLAIEEVVGTVRPKLSASVSAKVSGTVQQMLATPGLVVKAGQLLAQVDAREIQARHDQAVAIRDQAQKDLDRVKTLLDGKIITQQEFDAAQSRFRVAEGAVKEAATLLGYIRITAPFDGVVTVKHADVGDLAAPGKPLFEVEDPNVLRLEADVPEALIDRVKLGDKLGLRVPTANVAIDGVIGEIAPVADPVSRTFRVKLDLPTTTGLRSGQFGRVAVPVAEVNALRVPAGAVVVRGQMEIAFVVVNGKAQMRLVKTGKHLGDEIEVVAGLNPGEQLVSEGAAQLRDGQPAEVRK
ncbi:MAG: efflux RND transporter periplasmic adaptor subunit [Verrucomicrobia bacterium]|nr:efflux RND transporter periplasmic adaptor subunit [Verrucomicrobiota bacterium]